MPRQRRRLSLLLFFIPTSLFALALLHLSGDGAAAFSRAATPIQEANPAAMLALREEVSLPKPKSHHELRLLENASDGLEPSSVSVPKGTNWSEARSLLRRLHSNARSRRFSARAYEFFHGYPPVRSNPSCKVRFFMTWISSLDAFGRRELLSMESLFKFHPGACLLIVSSTMDSPRGARLLKPFKQMGFRVAAMSPDFDLLFKSTPARAWFKLLRKGEIDPGEVALGQNLSNLLRLAVLYKFGGIYIDTDVLVMKSFLGLKNVIGAQAVDAETGNWSRLNNAVMIFDRRHPLLYKFIEEFVLTFDGNKWGHNGPYLVSRVVSRVIGRPGFMFTVLPPVAFYPVDWNRIEGLFQGPQGGNHSKWVMAKLDTIWEESFAVHLRNKQSRGMKVEEKSAIARIMLDCCVFCNFAVSAL
ncbi:uncharacterized protein [Elaeis guineensis]|uniref:Lactosylceramide 4-alpha-galactosyltransferase isoform X1 n=1 Tax=Elaeis guineensis var. tenera TaxID=51953 RepID=A0A6I9S0N6_ELAGV|nr:lactosylceramide 4-alpha-galactosyltransferase isoform X1 [Elaeis guineensis]